MELRVLMDESVVLQLSTEESDRLLGKESSSVLRDVYFFADDFFAECDDDLVVSLDVGEPYGIFEKKGVGRYDWKQT